MASNQRSVGKLGSANRIVDRYLTLGERLTRSHPGQATAYVLLSEGYVQKAKNAYREDEAPVITQWEQKALDAATQAEKLEPESDEPRVLVKHCRGRLDKISSQQRQGGLSL
jgi:hypothetical protein